MNDTAQAPSDTTITVQPADASANTNTVTRKPWQFQPGNNANPHGRPRKGQTIADRVAKADAAIARKAIKARDKRLELTNAVGERAWTTYLAYNLGLPKQTYVIEQGDAAGMGWLQQLAGETVDGEARAVDE